MSYYLIYLLFQIVLGFSGLSLINTIHNKDLNSYYLVEFDVLEFINSDGRLLNGNCCSGYKSSGLCRGGNATCRPFWKICITEQQNNSFNNTLIMPKERKQDNKLQTTKKPSIFRNILNRIFGSSSSSMASNNMNGDNNFETLNTSSSCSIAFWTTNTILRNSSLPIPLKSYIISKKLFNGNENHILDPFKSKRLLVLVEVWHKQKPDTNDKLIARYIETKNITIESNGVEDINWNYGGKSKKQNNSTNNLQFQFRWRISPTFSDSVLNITEENTCPVGWTGNDCEEPICLESCNRTHGYCEQPDKCQCRFGWTGMYCDHCLTIPGCIHGFCNKPLECRCEEGWTGMFCSIPKCKEGCHPTNGYCSIPGECKCRFGWEGDNCSQCSTLPGCQHGSCVEPLDCNCDEGWDGMFCSTPLCSNGCDTRNGWCRRPNECRCKLGFNGVNCTECVPYPGCENGFCKDNPWTCECNPGWGGITCSERLNWCEMNSNPCLNSGTCIDVEKADGSYICKCNIGYTGRHCEKLQN